MLLPLVVHGQSRLEIVMAPQPVTPVVGQMIEVTVRGYYDARITNEKLSIPRSDSFDWIQTRADDWKEIRIDGRSWLVMERHLAVWPRRAGLLQFGPVEHDLNMVDRTGTRLQQVLRGEPMELAVAAHPHAGRNGWHFAASALEIEDELSTDPAMLPDGGTVTRRVRLRALGALPEHLPPRPVVSEPWLITFAAPPRRELVMTDQGPMAEAVWEWQFRPEHGEPGVLGGVAIPWFDTRAHAMAEAVIAPLTIGYASWHTGMTPTGRIGTGRQLLSLAMVLAGLLAGLGLVVWRSRPAGDRDRMRMVLRRLDPREWLHLWRAHARGDLPAERRAAERLGLSAARKARIERDLYTRR